MGVTQKQEKPAYSPIPDDQSATESDDLLYEGFKHTRKSRWSRWLIVGGVVVFIAYSAVLVSIPYLWLKKERLHGANVIDSKNYLVSLTQPILTPF